ncbi:hypothetical protein QLQ86_16985 [Halomonas sp. LR5S13]|uniref:hypothetical protein n=1 Tax=Halomonas rhizosphaerae TaxID=3043296 RepID=UPI0024A7EEDB|nr:hypothetical protein [Halomonas rhizosphaerae]MDI5922481.1 hypothetical protein [Halomonas rhizosphaerae]
MEDKGKGTLNDYQEATDFIGSLPFSVQQRLFNFSEERQEAGEVLIAVLLEEARALQLYDAIYDDVDNEYDLPNPMLSRVIRGCVDHLGQVPMGADRDALICEYPQILDAIKSAYKKHATAQIET